MTGLAQQLTDPQMAAIALMALLVAACILVLIWPTKRTPRSMDDDYHHRGKR